jgi:hypothetical protein
VEGWGPNFTELPDDTVALDVFCQEPPLTCRYGLIGVPAHPLEEELELELEDELLEELELELLEDELLDELPQQENCCQAVSIATPLLFAYVK